MNPSKRPTEFVLSDIVYKLIKTDLSSVRSITSRSIRRDVKRWSNSRTTKKFIANRVTILYNGYDLEASSKVVLRILEPIIRGVKSKGEIVNNLKVSVKNYGKIKIEQLADERFIWLSNGKDEAPGLDVLLKLVFVDDLDDMVLNPGLFVIGKMDPDTTYIYNY